MIHERMNSPRNKPGHRQEEVTSMSPGSFKFQMPRIGGIITAMIILKKTINDSLNLI